MLRLLQEEVDVRCSEGRGDCEAAELLSRGKSVYQIVTPPVPVSGPHHALQPLRQDQHVLHDISTLADHTDIYGTSVLSM